MIIVLILQLLNKIYVLNQNPELWLFSYSFYLWATPNLSLFFFFLFVQLLTWSFFFFVSLWVTSNLSRFLCSSLWVTINMHKIKHKTRCKPVQKVLWLLPKTRAKNISGDKTTTLKEGVLGKHSVLYKSIASLVQHVLGNLTSKETKHVRKREETGYVYNNTTTQCYNLTAFLLFLLFQYFSNLLVCVFFFIFEPLAKP